MWLPRDGRSRTLSTSWSAHTPVALTTARARRSNSAPVSSSRTRAPSAARLQHPAPGDDPGPLAGRGPGDGGDQPGIVLDLAVPVQVAAAQPVDPQSRGQRQRLLGRDAPGPGQQGGRGTGGPAEHVAGRDPDPVQPPGAGRYAGRQRQHDPQRPHQVRRRGAHQDAAFPGALEGHRHVTAGQVAQAAVHQLRTPPGGAVGQVSHVDRRHRQSPAGRVEGGSGPGHAEPDHEQVDRSAIGQPGQLLGPTGGVEGGCCRASVYAAESRR